MPEANEAAVEVMARALVMQPLDTKGSLLLSEAERLARLALAALTAAGYAVVKVSESVPRRFVLRRHEDETGVSGTGDVAWGVSFPDGTCVTRWCVTEIRQTCVWLSLEDVNAVHGHNGKTEFVWLDEDTDA